MQCIHTDDQLVYKLEGLERLWALRSKVSTSKDSIVSVQWQESFSDWRDVMVRMPGTFVPYLIMAGSYKTNMGREFVYAHSLHGGFLKPSLRNVLVVTTKESRYSRIIVQMSQQDAQKVIDWWQEA